jgi:mono/diheme cytochrome c family protein
MWNHGPAMMETMREKGIERPGFTGAELRDLIAFLMPRGGAGPEGPVYALPGRAEEGRKLFAEKRCTECHGAGTGPGRAAPDLVDRLVRRSPVEFAAAMWNKAPAMWAAQRAKGVPVPQLRAEEMADLVAYLYAVRYFAEPGSVQNGWAVATYKGCLVCHGLRGERGKPASDLGRAKGLDSPAGVLAALWNHAVVTPKAPSGQKTPWPEFRPEEMADLAAALQSLGKK